MDNPPSFTPIEKVGEFGLIDRMQQVIGFPNDDAVLAGPGDDAAVYRVSDGQVHVVTTDALLEGVHFNRAFMPMHYLGQKAIAVNVSDVVAMNAEPRYATIALGLPQDASVEMIENLYRGLKQAADLYGVTLLGGDTTAAHRMTLSVTVIGAAAEEAVVYRSGARPGDLLCVTGDLGGGYAGLKVLAAEYNQMRTHGTEYVPDMATHAYVIGRQLTPSARLDITRTWAEKGIQPRALIDISDGLASEIHHLCRMSDCGALLHATTIPVDLETRQVADLFEEDVDTYALYGGEDYELLFALPPDQLGQLPPDTFTVLGAFTEPEADILIQTPEGTAMPLGAVGYRHFG